MAFKLGINTGFAVNRYSEPEEWIRIVGEDLRLGYVQVTADLLNPDLPAPAIRKQIQRINTSLLRYNVKVCSTFTGAFTRLNHLAHPDADIRQHWIAWFKKFVDISIDIGSDNLGSHFGIFTHKDNNDLPLRQKRRQQNIEAWHEIADYAKNKGMKYLSWEPMSISREQGETIAETRILQDEVNKNSPLSFALCLDVDHGDICSPNPDDTDCYKWLETFAREAPLIHLKQSSQNKMSHWPFTKENNEKGCVKPEKVIAALQRGGRADGFLLLELSFRERNPVDQTVVGVLRESVNYWRKCVPL